MLKFRLNNFINFIFYCFIGLIHSFSTFILPLPPSTFFHILPVFLFPLLHFSTFFQSSSSPFYIFPHSSSLHLPPSTFSTFFQSSSSPFYIYLHSSSFSLSPSSSFFTFFQHFSSSSYIFSHSFPLPILPLLVHNSFTYPSSSSTQSLYSFFLY